jgi:hypothetical protein
VGSIFPKSAAAGLPSPLLSPYPSSPPSSEPGEGTHPFRLKPVPGLFSIYRELFFYLYFFAINGNSNLKPGLKQIGRLDFYLFSFLNLYQRTLAKCGMFQLYPFHLGWRDGSFLFRTTIISFLLFLLFCSFLRVMAG